MYCSLLGSSVHDNLLKKYTITEFVRHTLYFKILVEASNIRLGLKENLNLDSYPQAGAPGFKYFWKQDKISGQAHKESNSFPFLSSLVKK